MGLQKRGEAHPGGLLSTPWLAAERVGGRSSPLVLEAVHHDTDEREENNREMGIVTLFRATSDLVLGLGFVGVDGRTRGDLRSLHIHHIESFGDVVSKLDNLLFDDILIK